MGLGEELSKIAGPKAEINPSRGWREKKGKLPATGPKTPKAPVEVVSSTRSPIPPISNASQAGGEVGSQENAKIGESLTVTGAALFQGDIIKQHEEKQEEGISIRVAHFLRDHPEPDDKEFHAWAESQGIETDEAEAAAYALASKYVAFVFGGKSKGVPPKGIDPEQLRMGIEVEKEHIDDPAAQAKIACDHLHEFKFYYDALNKMESELKRMGD